MAATTAGRRLTEAHRLAQTRLGAETVRLMLATFPMLDLDDLDGSFAAWLRVVTPLVQAQRSASARMAGSYLLAYRTVELGVRAPAVSPLLAEVAPVEALATSMLVTGPISIRSNLARQVPAHRALDIAHARTAAAAMRHALNGGRQTITDTVALDQAATGWARVTSGNACKFCSMLAGRGAVYSEQSVGFEAHDGCSCSAEPELQLG